MIKRNLPTYIWTSICFSVLTFFISACGSSRGINYDYIYFKEGGNSVTAQQKETVIQPNDLINIQVFSKTLNQQQAAIFNLHDSSSGSAQGYLVSAAGTVEMPVIGSLKVVGLNKYQLQNMIMEKLTDYVKNPSVIVRFLQFNVNVLGEVRSPGVQKFLLDKVTIIDAISAAGDLTDVGRRDGITVIREEGGKKVFHAVDLRSKSIFESPVYLLQPNDIVYVSPSNNKLRLLSKNVNTQQSIGLVFSAVSLITSLVSLFTIFAK